MRCVYPLVLIFSLLVSCGQSHKVSVIPSNPPELLSVSPTSLRWGEPFVVEGSNFGSVKGRLLFAGQELPAFLIKVWSERRIEAYVPHGAVSGDIVVVVGGVSSNRFYVNVVGTTEPLRSPPWWRSGGLAGYRICVSPGHGYYYSATLGYWTTQRGDINGLIEDIHTNEICMDYLIPYLERAGAEVYTCRERHRQRNEVICDNDAGSPTYTETGSWSDGAYTGYGGGGYRWVLTEGSETAVARFWPNIPEDGEYPVWAWWRAGTNRTTSALFRIHHAAGTTELFLDQTKNDMRWVYLGTYYFYAGYTQHCVEVSNYSTDTGKVVVADAVRFGAGEGSIARGSPPITSGKPRWQECSRYWLEYLGAPSYVYDEQGLSDRSDDVVARKKYANWQDTDIFISIHTNGYNGTASGTETYIHTNPYSGSQSLQHKVHTEVVRNIRLLWDLNWTDRGEKSADFGELRDNNRPAILIELAFHDNTNLDNLYLHEDEFRHICARAILKGVQRFFGLQEVSPLPPINFTVRSLGYGYVLLSWEAQEDPADTQDASPTHYVVYRSRDGLAWDNGFVTTKTEVAIGGLNSGVWFFCVSAANSAGESLTSEVLAAYVVSAGPPYERILIVNGFDRLDRFVTYRNRENTFNFVRQHADAVSSAGYIFDSASNEAVEKGEVSLADYKVVVWILGEESTVDETFSDDEQRIVADYLDSGGRLFVSGAEILWDLDEKGDAGDRAFVGSYLGAGYLADDAGTYIVTPEQGSIFDGLGNIEFDDGTNATYDVDYPDVLVPQIGATVLLRYSGGQHNGEPAAVAYSSGNFRVVLLAFPFETIISVGKRRELMERALMWLTQ